MIYLLSSDFQVQGSGICWSLPLEIKFKQKCCSLVTAQWQDDVINDYTRHIQCPEPCARVSKRHKFEENILFSKCNLLSTED